MNKETIDIAWACLPGEFKEEVKKRYNDVLFTDYDSGYDDALTDFFGEHNLTSDAEGEEMLTCEKYKVEEALNYCDELDAISGNHNMRNWGEQMIAYLFGSKCLPDEPAIKEPKPAEPTDNPIPSNSGELKPQETCTNDCSSQCSSQDFDTILKDGFSKERRLNIAKDFASVLLSRLNYDPFTAQINCCCSDGATVNPYINIARIALSVADALIAESEKGVDNA